MTWVVEVNEGAVDATRQGALWWMAYRQVNGDRIAVDGGTAHVRCDSRGHAESLRRVMTNRGFTDISIEEGP